MGGTISREVPWEIMVDLFFYRDPDEAEKEEQAAIEAKQPKESEYQAAPVTGENWNPDAPAAPAAEVTDWATETVAVAPVPIQPGLGGNTEDWSATDTGDWAAPAPAGAPAAVAAPAAAPVAAPAATNEWGGSAAENWG